MVKLRKFILIPIFILFLSISTLLIGCSNTNAQAESSADEHTKMIESLKSKFSSDSFEKIAKYLKDNGQIRDIKVNDQIIDTEYYIEQHRFYPNSTTIYSYYRELAFSKKNNSLILKGITNKSATAVTLEIPYLNDYSNYQFTYNASYSTKNNYNKDVTLKATFTAPAQNYLITTATSNLPELVFDAQNKHLSVSIGTAKLTNFKKTIPNAIREAEEQLKTIFADVNGLDASESTYAYKIFFYLPSFKNPLAI